MKRDIPEVDYINYTTCVRIPETAGKAFIKALTADEKHPMYLYNRLVYMPTYGELAKVNTIIQGYKIATDTRFRHHITNTPITATEIIPHYNAINWNEGGLYNRYLTPEEITTGKDVNDEVDETMNDGKLFAEICYRIEAQEEAEIPDLLELLTEVKSVFILDDFYYIVLRPNDSETMETIDEFRGDDIDRIKVTRVDYITRVQDN